MAENRSIALAAVIVTGVVGVAGPYITWKAIRDTGKLASHTILVQGDRADFRTVLDEAALVLRQRTVDERPIVKDWMEGDGPLDPERVARFHARLERMAAIAERLLIRLGPNSPLYQAYNKSLADVTWISDRLLEEPSEARKLEVSTRQRKLQTNSEDFYRRATTEAGSILR